MIWNPIFAPGNCRTDYDTAIISLHQRAECAMNIHYASGVIGENNCVSKRENQWTGWVSHCEPQSFDVILCSAGFQLSTAQGNGRFVSLGHILYRMDGYFAGCVGEPSSLHLPLVLHGCTLWKGISLNQNWVVVWLLSWVQNWVLYILSGAVILLCCNLVYVQYWTGTLGLVCVTMQVLVLTGHILNVNRHRYPPAAPN